MARGFSPLNVYEGLDHVRLVPGTRSGCVPDEGGQGLCTRPLPLASFHLLEGHAHDGVQGGR